MTDPAAGYEPGVLRVLRNRADTRSFYNKIAKVYDLLAESSEQPMREAGLKLLAAAPGESILEVGCGTGHCLVSIAQGVGPTGKAHGLDLSEGMLEHSRKLLEQHQLADRVELHRCDAADLPFETDSLDGIFTSFTLELFDTPEMPKVLAEWRRVLKPGGRLVVVAVSKSGPREMMVKAFEWTHQHFPNLMDCRPIFVAGALEAAGFTIEASEIQMMWAPVEIVRGGVPSPK